MIANITHIGCAEQGITYSMDKYIGIAMTKKTHRMLYLHTTQPKIPTLDQLVNIISKSDPHNNTM
jgi:hypothetical protein